MKRIRIDPQELLDHPWQVLSEKFNLNPCCSAQDFERSMLRLHEPMVLVTGGRSGYDREVLDVLESVQQKSDSVFVIWSAEKTD